MSLLSIKLLVCAAAAAAYPGQANHPPKTRTEPVKEVLHGVEIADPYRWLEDQNSPQTRAWIEEQNRFSRPLLDTVPDRAALVKRFAELLKADVTGMPTVLNGRYFFSKRRANQDLSLICVRRGLKGKDEVLVDPHPLSPDHLTSVSILGVSPDGSTLIYGVRKGGEDEVEVRLLDVDSRKELPDRLPTARYYGLDLTPDKSVLYYSRFGKEGPRVFRHTMGADPRRDSQIFGKDLGRDKGLFSQLSEDGRYLLVHLAHGVGGTSKIEIYVQDLSRGGPVAPVVKDIDARFMGSVAGDRLFVETTWKAPKGRILAIDLKNPDPKRWREVVPEGRFAIDGFSVAGGKLFVGYLENVVSRVKVFEPDGRHVRDLAFPDLGTVTPVAGRWSSNEAFFLFTSFHIPPTIYRYEVASGAREVWARRDIPVDSSRFELKQVWYSSRDKTRVPMFLLHRKGLKLDGARPALLTGYGGFAVNSTPVFRADAIVWAERGGVFALPNLRGGAEFGEDWHRAGMLHKKQNVFDDFHAAGEWLIEQRYTSPSRLGIMGTSNGGLLVGAALTQRPELFGAVVCRYPLLDMVRYHKFSVARWWVPEYGSSETAEDFKNLSAYSPYHRVRPGIKYPAVLFVTGDSDTRVDPLHARKMTALMQAATGSSRPVLLLYDTKSGHTGARPVAKQIEDDTDQIGFLWWQLGGAK